MIEWFKNLSDANKIAIIIPITVAVIGGLIGLFKWLFRKKDDLAASEKTIQQVGTGHTATSIDGDKNIVAGRDVSTGIDSDAALKMLVEMSTRLGREQKEKDQLRDDLEKAKELRKAEVKDAIKDVVKEVLIDIRDEKEAT